MGKRVQFLDDEKMESQVIYPTLGLFWEGEIADPYLADAHCRAYNTWTFELCSPHKNRLYPAAHISMRDPQLAVREMERIAKLGGRTIFVAAAPIEGKSFGLPEYDPVWAAAQDFSLISVLASTSSVIRTTLGVSGFATAIPASCISL